MQERGREKEIGTKESDRSWNWEEQAKSGKDEEGLGGACMMISV